MSKDKLLQQAADAEHAQRLLDDPLIKRFFESAEAAVVETWKNSDIDDERGQKFCRIALRCQQNLREQFKHCIINGEKARKDLLLREKEPSKIRRMING